jgi:hypothetical protein
MRISKNPFLLLGENMTRTSIPNFKFVRCVFFGLQRSVTKWHFNFIYVDKYKTKVEYDFHPLQFYYSSRIEQLWTGTSTTGKLL